jgi:uncharacterized protein YecE (DUF72 family)
MDLRATPFPTTPLATLPGIRIGISGWRYPAWRGVFYPEDLVQRRELEFASRRFSSIELNGSFYSLQRAESWRAWAAQTPDDFVFAVKGSGYITHRLRLRGIGPALSNFLASGLLELGPKLGPLLWQFPPQLAYDETRMRDFIKALPRDTHAALALARDHDARVRHAAVPSRLVRRPLRHAFEVRHESFRDPGFIALLRRHGIALVVADTAGRWPYMEDVTADFMYLRLHGDKQLYASGYTPRALARWAGRIRAWHAGGEPADAVRASAKAPRRRSTRDVYVYFDNDIKVRAPFDARALMRRLSDPA